MYRADQKTKPKPRRRWLFLFIIVLLGAGSFFGYTAIKHMLKPDTQIKQSKAVNSVITYSNKLKHYDEPDFGIDLPIAWQQVSSDTGEYRTYRWQLSDKGTDGQIIQIFEDTIPPNFGVNRALIVSGEGQNMSINGEVSDNCTAYTKNQAVNAGPATSTVNAPAKWQGTDFLCDTVNTDRNVTGTSSSDGIDTVILRSPATGQAHKFFFLYTTQSLNPDYTVFYNALKSLKMQ